MHIKVYGGCSSWSCDSIKVCNRTIRYTSEGCVCCPREGLGAPLAESLEVLKPKEERIGQLL